MELSILCHPITFYFSVPPYFLSFLFVIPVSVTACGICSYESETDSYNFLLPVVVLLATENNSVFFS